MKKEMDDFVAFKNVTENGSGDGGNNNNAPRSNFGCFGIVLGFVVVFLTVVMIVTKCSPS